jgi:SAM-dependent methyltransferase
LPSEAEVDVVVQKPDGRRVTYEVRRKAEAGVRLNLGCGRRAMPGFVNVDCVPLPGVDLVVDLDDPVKVSLPWADDSVDEFAMIHVYEHLRWPLPLLQELWRVAKPDATLMICCPYGSSDDADEDPTHVRRIFLNSFLYAGQPAYFRADYGFRGDWDVDHLVLDLGPQYAGVPVAEVMADVASIRNVVSQITAVLRAVKPAREPLQELIRPPRVALRVG